MENSETQSVSVVVMKLCKLCLEEFSPDAEMFTISSCQCTFCKQCMQCYVEVLIRDHVVLSISCPDSGCAIAGNITAEEIKTLVQDDTFEKYQRLKFEQEVATDPHRTFCPQVSCATVCHVCDNSPNDETINKPIAVSCPTCELRFCNICKAEWKSSHKCTTFSLSLGTEFQKLQNITGLNLGNDSTIKRCPVCDILIEKDRGCAQMVCRNCSHVFCWYCFKLLDNDFMLRHYDKGPCRDMLGHSRAQVMRHRIGVVGLLIAVALLAIVASPVIIIVAPFILCCKCKDCYQKAINRGRQHRNSVESQGDVANSPKHDDISLADFP